MKENVDEVQVIEYTPRAPCRFCGRLYVWPKGSKAPGGVGPCCQARLDEASAASPERDRREGAADVSSSFDDERELPPVPVPPALCSGCRYRLADGVLQPGSLPLCVGCAVETVEHWLEWLDDPSHDWRPTDDPFSSALHPVEGWRSTELENGAVRL